MTDQRPAPPVPDEPVAIASLIRDARAFIASRRHDYELEATFDCAVAAKLRDDLPAYFNALRKLHALNAAGVRGGRYDPFLVKWHRIFSPIEEDAWNAILECGLSMFPQYPVGRYFVDFGDPWRRQAIECDGAAYHDARRDARRDAALRGLGWSVLRIPGKSLVLGEESPNSGDAIVRAAFGLQPKTFGDEGEHLGGVWRASAA